MTCSWCRSGCGRLRHRCHQSRALLQHLPPDQVVHAPVRTNARGVIVATTNSSTCSSVGRWGCLVFCLENPGAQPVHDWPYPKAWVKKGVGCLGYAGAIVFAGGVRVRRCSSVARMTVCPNPGQPLARRQQRRHEGRAEYVLLLPVLHQQLQRRRSGAGVVW